MGYGSEAQESAFYGILAEHGAGRGEEWAASS